MGVGSDGRTMDRDTGEYTVLTGLQLHPQWTAVDKLADPGRGM